MTAVSAAQAARASATALVPRATAARRSASCVQLGGALGVAGGVGEDRVGAGLLGAQLGVAHRGVGVGGSPLLLALPGGDPGA